MEATTRLAQVIARKVNGKYKDNGIDCYYYQLSRKVGLKMYSGWEKGIWSYLVQDLLASKGMSPKTYGYCLVDGSFAFFTQQVFVYRTHNQQKYSQKRGEWIYYCSLNKAGVNAMNEITNSVVKEFPNWVPCDSHQGNLGFTRNWDKTINPMVIDVGHYIYKKQNREDAYSMYQHSNPMFAQHKQIRSNIDHLRNSVDRVRGFSDMKLPCVRSQYALSA